jgi:uncharacterized membrane protein YphA (DoxX/SURF4 family)
MFPNGWPGRGLLLLRVVACSLTAYEGIAAAFAPIPYAVVMQQIIAMICAFLLLIGLATPLAAIALSLCEVWVVFSNRAQWPVAVALGGVAFALAMLGPGSISIDARLFGRKRIDLTQGGPS